VTPQRPAPQRPAPPSTRNRVLAVLVLVLVLVAAWWLRGGSSPEEPGTAPAGATSASDVTSASDTPSASDSPSATGSSSASDAPSAADGIPPCDPAALPAELEGVVDDVLAGGPYDYPRNDGVRFQNREGILPDESPDYYREFTVETPGVDHRGARRVVTGGELETDPERWYYTGDHYESFCAFAP
jgi:ribonuclease T1